MGKRVKLNVFTGLIILLLIALNVYLYATKAIPGAIEGSMDIRYNRVCDFMKHKWAGVEEFPSMLCCMLPLALFPSIESARIGWLVANFIFVAIILYCLRKTIFSDCNNIGFAIVGLLFCSSVPVIIAFMNGQNLLFSFAFFMLAYYLTEKTDTKKVGFLSFVVGILLGISYFKYSVIFFIVPIFIYKKRYFEIAVSAIMHVVLNLFSMYWLNVSLTTIITSPITTSVSTNKGVGYIDLMTLFNSDLITIFRGGARIKSILDNHHGNYIYMGVVAVTIVIMLIIAFKGKAKEEGVFAMYCALSTVLIYHRQYDFFVLAIPMYYCLKKLVEALNKWRLIKGAFYLVSLAGMAMILWGNWVFKALGLSIEYGLWQQVYYGTAILGLYLLCVISVLGNLLERK